jgi:signal transduction histidine kinase/MFS family permease
MPFHLKLILVSQLIVFFANLSIGAFVVIKKRFSRISLYFGAFSLSLAFWNLCIFLILNEAQPLIFWSRLGFAFGAVMSTALFVFAYIFPANKKPNIYLKISSFAFAFLLIVISFTNMMVSDVNVANGYIKGSLGPAVYVYMVYALLCVFSSLMIFAFKYSKAEKAYKTQLLCAFAGISLFVVAVFITQLFLPLVFGIFKYNNLGPVFSLPMVAMMAYAIVRHKFMDISVAFQKSLIYSLVLGFVIALYLLFVFIFGYLFQRSTSVAAVLSAFFTTLIGIYGVPGIEKHFQRLTDPIFFKDKYDYPKAIYELSKILNSNIDLEKLLGESAEKLKDIVKVNRAYFIFQEENAIFGDKGKLEKLKVRIPKTFIREAEKSSHKIILRNEIPLLLENETIINAQKGALNQAEALARTFAIEVIASIKLENKLIGFLLLSRKLSGDNFDEKDTRLLKTFVYQAAVAIEKAKLYEQVREYSERLEEKVWERTEEIKALQEEQKQMMLEIGHGLQTPLTIMKAEISLLQKESAHLPEMRSLEKSIDRISKFIYDMLKLARLEYGDKGALEYAKIDLSEFLRELIEDYKTITGEKNIAIIEMIENNIFIKGGRSQIDELVTNLVSNSVKYMDEKKAKEIQISLAKKGKYARLIIKDNGIGIPEENLKMIFSRFYRVNNDNREKGTGLGLAISKRIVEMHGGRIKIESREGEFTSMIIDLPLVGGRRKT